MSLDFSVPRPHSFLFGSLHSLRKPKRDGLWYRIHPLLRVRLRDGSRSRPYPVWTRFDATVQAWEYVQDAEDEDERALTA